MPKMLVVDDEAQYSNQLRSVLLEHGWTVEVAETGRDALQLLTNFRFDFVLLDWNLPEMSGLEICKKYRNGGGDAPIMFVTGRTAIDDKESGLEAGGDDYITKPFDARELLARIKAINRRPGSRIQANLTAQGVSLDPRQRTVSRTSDSVQLSSLESALVEFLIRNKGSFFSASQLFNAVWDSDSEATDETVRVRIRIIRQKLAKIGAEDLIEHVRGNGYVIRDV